MSEETTLGKRLTCLENVVEALIDELMEASPHMEDGLSIILTKWDNTENIIRMEHKTPDEVFKK